jgi:hypothetical protein
VKLRVAIVLGFALAVAATAHANTVSPICKLNNSTTVDCTTWHSGDVTLRWTWDPFGSETGTSGCGTTTFSSDTPSAGASQKCTVSWGPTDVSYTATVRVDMTKPVVTAASPLRAPDFGGWFNHPVPVGFAGTDALSGISSCDTVTYAGPDGAAAAVTGGCRDVAGNRAVASFPLAYDSTAPAPAQVTAAPENGSIVLSWVPPADADSVVVVRQAQAAAAKTVYRGDGRKVTDHGLRNGVRYRYTITVLDQAGNANATTASAVPTASKLRPVAGTAVTAPPRLTWKTAKGATYYNVQLFKGRKKVLSAWPHGNHLQLRAKWKYRGHKIRLKTGTYRWYVWPGLGARAAERYGHMIGRSSFHVS